MNSLETLPQDLIIRLLDDLLDDYYIAPFMLSCTSKVLYQIISSYAISRQIPRILRCHEIASKGYLDILQLAREIGYQWNSDVCANAAKIGRLDIIEWAISQGCTTSNSTCLNAANFGHIEILKWAQATNQKYNQSSACQLAALNGHLEIVQWISDKEKFSYSWSHNGSARSVWASDESGAKPHFFRRSTYLNVIASGREDILQLIITTDRDFDNNDEYEFMADDMAEMCAATALHGNLQMLQILREKGFHWDANTCENAVRGGYLDVIKWARSNG